MALAVNLILMMAALALVAFPLLKSDSAAKTTSSGTDQGYNPQQAALAEAELDKAMGKAEDSDYKAMTQRLGAAQK